MDAKTKPNPSVKPKPKPATLGPVTRLEDFVHKEWWRQIFNSLYLKTDGDVVTDQELTRGEVDTIINILQPKADDKILDLCCGQGRHTIELASRGLSEVEGYDRSRYLISKAKTDSRKANLNLRFKEGDARKLPYKTDSFDYLLILGNSFGYFEAPQDDLRVLNEVKRVLQPGGTVLLDLADGNFLRNNYQKRSWEWINKQYFVCRERELAQDGRRLISREVITHTQKGVIADQFYAERLYTKEQAEQLLLDAGFTNIQFHGSIATDSQRNQDLGMMEQRIIVTATIDKNWTPVKAKSTAKETIKVTVLMGDPEKFDSVKPDGKFDEDDYETINELKKALAEIPNMEIKYLDHHDTLLADLQKLKGKTDIVFNLCDEGFNNDPKKELHVPALLEVFELPYTGGNPQCLAHCYDKSLIRGIAREMGIPVPEAFFISPDENIYELTINFPVIVKPNSGDSSFGITQNSVCYNVEELITRVNRVRELLGRDIPLLVEEYLTGSDASVGIIGNMPSSYTVLPITEEDYSSLPEELPHICGYEAKWDPTSPYWHIKSVAAKIPDATQKQITEYCLKMFERVKCRDYARFDWRLDAQANPKLLEVNPNPGWCWDGHLYKMARIAGWSYSQMLERIITAGWERYNNGRD